MSLTLVRSVMNSLNTTQAWSVSLVKIKNSKRNGTSYAVRGITIAPEGALMRLVTGLSDVYINTDTGVLNKYTTVCDYDGSTEAIKIYKLPSTSELITNEFQRLIQAFLTPETQGDPLEFAANAYALKASIEIDGEEKNVIMFSLQNPICVLKNRFVYDESTFHELNKRVLNLRQSIDVLVIDNSVYFLTMAGEKLFNMERSYKAIGEQITTDICASGMISNFDLFKQIATSGHNPRRFVSFNKERYEKMKSAAIRTAMAATFRLTLTPEGQIDTSTEQMAEKLVKLLCNKGMVDPFEDIPVEVSGASRW